MIAKILSFGLLALGWLAAGTPAMSSPLVSGETGQEEQAMPVADGSLTLGEWVAQAGETNAAEITDVQISPATEGITISLTATQSLSPPTSRVSGNALIIEIPNAMLSLTDETVAEQFGPAEGLALVQVSAVSGDRVQVVITGSEAVPTVQIGETSGNLVLSVVPGIALVSEAVGDVDSEDEAIRLTVTAATRTEASPLDVPQSIQVIPRDVIEARGVNNLTDALRSVPGVTPNFNSALFNDVVIRGFSADFRRDGLNNFVPGSASIQTANIERLEILRGPASVLYGQGSFGGTVNVITEQPTDEPFYRVEASAGSFDLYRGAIDLSGPLDEDETVKYRLNIAAETENSFIDDIGRDRLLVAPVLSWAVGEDTDITFELEYSELTADNNFGIPVRGTILDNVNGEISRSRYIGDADREFRDINTLIVGYDVEHRINDDWEISNAYQFTSRQAPEFTVSGIELLADERTLERDYLEVSRFDTYSHLLETNIVGRFNTGSIEHELLAGVEISFDRSPGEGSFGLANSIDLFSPDDDELVLEPIDDVFQDEFSNRSLGIYLQDRIDILDNLTLLLGGRFDIATTRFEDFVFEESDFQQEEEFSPRVGIVYQPIPELSLYSSYSRSFIPNFFERGRNGEIFDSQRGNQFEIGAKADINDKLSLTLAYFDLSITNVPTSDPENTFFSIVTGRQRSQGVDLLASGEILPGWNIIGGYTYNDARVTEDTDISIGNRIPNNPAHSASLFSSYEIQQGSFQGLGFGLGLFYVGERAGDLDNTFDVPSYVRTDALLSYKRGGFRTALNFENLFDIDYFDNAEDELRVRPGAPFAVRASVSWDF